MNKEVKDIATIPFFAHEEQMARLDSTIKRLWVLCILLVVLLVGTNIAWIVYEGQLENVVVTQQNEDGYNNYVGNDGDIYNGNPNN